MFIIDSAFFSVMSQIVRKRSTMSLNEDRSRTKNYKTRFDCKHAVTDDSGRKFYSI